MFGILKIRGFTPCIVGKVTIICLTIIFLIGQVGCAAKTPPPRLTYEMRAQLGKIGVVPARFIPETTFRTPAKGWLGGVGRGAAAGFSASEGLGTSVPSDAGFAGAAMAAGVLAIVATSTVIGGVYGAVAAEPRATVEGAETTLRNALAAMNVQRDFAEHLVESARTQTRYPFELLTDQGPRVGNEKVDYGPLAKQGVDTILEVSVLKFGLLGGEGVKPPVHVSMTVQVRLMRTADNTNLYERTFDYSGEDHKFAELAANDAQLFREAVAGACERLSDKVVDGLF